MRQTQEHRICDYSGTDYAAFWADGKRDYEDAAERIALRRLTRQWSGTCLEIGAGYGRLVDVYAPRCSRVVLTDFAAPLLAQAEARVRQLGLDHVSCRRVNLYELDAAGWLFDNAVCVRVLHHVESVPDFFRQVNYVLRDNGSFVLEYANKRNLLEVLRWLLRRPNLHPFSHRPSARKQNVYYNFHPAYIKEMLRRNGFEIEAELAVSIFRLPLLKRLVGQKRLAALEGPLQRLLGPLHPAPSVFVRARKVRSLPRP